MDKNDIDISAYDLGWIDGYNDKQPNNPFNYPSVEYVEYEAGYEQGSNDC